MVLLDCDAHRELITERQLMSVCRCIMLGKLKTSSNTMLTRPSVSFNLLKIPVPYIQAWFVSEILARFATVTVAEVRQPGICLKVWYVTKRTLEIQTSETTFFFFVFWTLDYGHILQFFLLESGVSCLFMSSNTAHFLSCWHGWRECERLAACKPQLQRCFLQD